jgi:23S rRNA (guanosine2251-2'-O)-methyltransferase
VENSFDKKQLVFGIHPVIECIEAGKNIAKVIVQQGLTGENASQLRNLLTRNDIPFQVVPVQRINRITSKNHQGVIAFLSEIEYVKLEQLLPAVYEKGETPFFVILDRVTDVRNFGAIARSAECAAIHGIIIPEKGGAVVTADAIKTSAGALMNIPVCRVRKLSDAVKYLKESGLQVVACTEKGVKPYFDINLTLPTALIMGSEQDGISDDLIRISDELCIIPMKGRTGSLNVSVAAGILFFESVRQNF